MDLILLPLRLIYHVDSNLLNTLRGSLESLLFSKSRTFTNKTLLVIIKTKQTFYYKKHRTNIKKKTTPLYLEYSQMHLSGFGQFDCRLV